MRTVPNISNLLRHIGNVITKEFIPAITGGVICSDGNFTPLVILSNGGLGRECGRFYSKLVEQIAEKRKQSYSIISFWIKRKIIFSL